MVGYSRVWGQHYVMTWRKEKVWQLLETTEFGLACIVLVSLVVP